MGKGMGVASREGVWILDVPLGRPREGPGHAPGAQGQKVEATGSESCPESDKGGTREGPGSHCRWPELTGLDRRL